MRIAVLGWGSLIWSPRDLPISGNWQEDGPVLPIEFSRISDNGRLTLVIDERHGVDVPTRYALSPRPTVGEAITDLHRREGCPSENIGFVEVATHRVSPRAGERHPAACEGIKAWAVEKGFDAVVWTALGRRFKDKINVPFSPAAAVRYLQGLPAPMKESALEYIRNAPPEVMTPVRRAVIEAALLPAVQPASDDETRPKPTTAATPNL